jgi:hypothetical protein
MNEEGARGMSGFNFLPKLLWRDADEDETSTYSVEELGTRKSKRRRGEPKEEHPPRGFSVERATEMIDDLPSDVSQESAARIVRGALVAAGIELSNFDRSTWAQVSKLSSEIELARNRQKEVQEKTEETVRSLKEEIRKAQESCDSIVAYEEKKISSASATLKEVRRVRAFFDLLKTEGEESPDSVEQGMQVLESSEVVEIRVRGRSGPLEATDKATTYEPSEDSSGYRNPSGPSNE